MKYFIVYFERERSYPHRKEVSIQANSALEASEKAQKQLDDETPLGEEHWKKKTVTTDSQRNMSPERKDILAKRLIKYFEEKSEMKDIREQTTRVQPWYTTAQSIVNHNSERIISNIEDELERTLSIDERVEFRILMTELINSFMSTKGRR